MSVTLCNYRGRPAIELPDHKGEVWTYLLRYRRLASRRCWLVRLACNDPERRRVYRLRVWDSGALRCSCPDWKYKNRQNRSRTAGSPCKHLESAAGLIQFLRTL